MGFRNRNAMEISRETMNDFMTDQLNRIFLSEKVVVTDVTESGDCFIIEFYPEKEKLQEAIEKRTDLQPKEN
jgi:hypothetical protein